MTSLPFRLSSLMSGEEFSPAQHSGMRCCQPGSSPAEGQVTRRAKLSELDTQYHCSVIGTCLSTADLRKLIPRFVDVDRAKASDLDLHHEAVQIAFDVNLGSKAINKCLDTRHELAIKRLQREKDPENLRAFWSESLKTGDIPGAYWALMTHPQVTSDLRKLAFGDVHMLSHLVGAANRADIRRLQALEQENLTLADKAQRQQERLAQVLEERDSALQQVAERDVVASTRPAVDGDERVTELTAQIASLQSELDAKDQALAHHTQRRCAAEAESQSRQEETAQVHAQLSKLLTLVDDLQDEVHAIEKELAGAHSAMHGDASRNRVLSERRILYVGGRPGSNRTIKAMVEAAGGEIVVHDGGIEDRKGLLAAALPRMDMVVFPVDCIDHDSMSTLKRACDKYQIAFYPVRTASAASFSALIARIAAPLQAASISRFCLKHG